jgi:hypothetical protein
MPNASELSNHRYLGDSVYASFDGYHVWLHLNRHDAPPLIALELSVIRALLDYSKEMLGPYAQIVDPTPTE